MRRLILGTGVLSAGAGAVYALSVPGTAYASVKEPVPVLSDRVPSREEQWANLSQGTASNPYDVLVVGGGATGTGVAIDSATRVVRGRF